MSTDWEEAFLLFECMIAQEDEAVKLQAIIELARLSNYVPEDMLTRVVPILVNLLENSSGNSIQEASVYCLKCIAYQHEGRLAEVVGQSGAIPSLLRLLPVSEGNLQKFILECLRNILTFGDSNRKIVARNNGLQLVLNMLNSRPIRFRRLLLEILSALALLWEVRRVIINVRAVNFLVESARCGSMISRTRAAQALGLIGMVRRSRHKLVDLGAIEALMELLRHGDNSTKMVAGNAIGVIASHVDFIRPLARAGAIPLFAELIEGSEPMGKDIAEDVFCVLAVSEASGVVIVEHLARILGEGNSEAKAKAADVLWNLCGYRHLCSVIQKSGVVSILVELLRDENGDVREKVSMAVARLSNSRAGRAAIADLGGVSILVDMLGDESLEVRENAGEAIVNFSEDPFWRESVLSAALDLSFLGNVKEQMMNVRASQEELAVSLRQLSIEHLTGASTILD